MDYVSISNLLLEFEECETRVCVNVTINNDMTLEEEESFYVSGYSSIWLPSEETIEAFFNGEIKIKDDECKNL